MLLNYGMIFWLIVILSSTCNKEIQHRIHGRQAKGVGTILEAVVFLTSEKATKKYFQIQASLCTTTTKGK